MKFMLWPFMQSVHFASFKMHTSRFDFKLFSADRVGRAFASMGSCNGEDSPGLREWITVVLGCSVTFLFSYFFYGWAAMQAIFEADGVYKEICPEEEPLCSDRGSRMIFLFSVDNTVTIFAGISSSTVLLPCFRCYRPQVLRCRL